MAFQLGRVRVQLESYVGLLPLTIKSMSQAPLGLSTPSPGSPDYAVATALWTQLVFLALLGHASSLDLLVLLTRKKKKIELRVGNSSSRPHLPLFSEESGDISTVCSLGETGTKKMSQNHKNWSLVANILLGCWEPW